MCQPFSFLDELRLRSQSHEVTFDDKGGVLFPEEEWWSARVGSTGGFPTLVLE
jgi:hypothetical protein